MIPGEEVKNGQPIELPLPAAASAMLELYRTRVRPVLAPPGTSWLFPGENGGRKALVTLGGQISRFLARELGVRLTPHQFRHLVGFVYLRQHPHGIEVVRALLGHRSINDHPAPLCRARRGGRRPALRRDPARWSPSHGGDRPGTAGRARAHAGAARRRRAA